MQWKPVIDIAKADQLEKPVARELPLARYEGPVKIIHNNEAALTAIKTIKMSAYTGFDTESRPSFTKNQQFPVSLIQVAIPEPEMVYIFQIKNIHPDIWSRLLRSRKTVKAAIAIDHDVRQLQQLTPFTGYGMYDLSEAAEQIRLPVFSLRGLCALVYGARISKRQQLSNWSKTELTKAQILYAATDAWVSLKLYQFFSKHAPLKPHALPMPEPNKKRAKSRRH